MTPQEQAFNTQIKNDMSFIEVEKLAENLTENQSKIMLMIEEDRISNRDEFDKGSEMFKELYTKVDNMERQISNGFKQISDEAADRALADKTDEIKKLNKKLDARDAVKNGVIITLVGGVLLAVALYALSQLGITAPIK